MKQILTLKYYIQTVFCLMKNKTKNIIFLSKFWALFIGIGALFGSAMMFIDPSGQLFGMTLMLPDLQKLPFPEIFFQNFIFPGIALLCANGITNIISFVLICKKYRYAPHSVMACGVILMLWITIQFIIFDWNFMSTLYFVFGILQAWTGYRYWKKGA